MVCWIPNGQESHNQHRHKYQDDVPGVDAYRIGVNDKRPFCATQADNAVQLLNPTKQQADNDAYYSTDSTDDAPFEKEYL